MSEKHATTPSWLPELKKMVQEEMDQLKDRLQDQQPDLKTELAALRDQTDGWIKSLGSKDLDPTIRQALEKEWANVEKRKQSIEQAISARENLGQRTAAAVDEADVLKRLQKLADVLTKSGTTRANLELSLHVDRIECYADGSVKMRTCILGALPAAAELLDDRPPCGDPPSHGGMPAILSQGKQRRGPRRRGRLRTADYESDSGEGSREVTDFAADTSRFKSLPDQWFWVDEFQIPVKRSWVEENAERVLYRRDEIARETGKKPSLTVLAREFDKSRPTIRTAIDIATGKRPRPGARSGQRRKFSGPLDTKQRQEIVRLFHEKHKGPKEISVKCGVHRSTVDRILDDWDKERSAKRPDGRKRSKASRNG